MKSFAFVFAIAFSLSIGVASACWRGAPDAGCSLERQKRVQERFDEVTAQLTECKKDKRKMEDFISDFQDELIAAKSLAPKKGQMIVDNDDYRKCHDNVDAAKDLNSQNQKECFQEQIGIYKLFAFLSIPLFLFLLFVVMLFSSARTKLAATKAELDALKNDSVRGAILQRFVESASSGVPALPAIVASTSNDDARDPDATQRCNGAVHVQNATQQHAQPSREDSGIDADGDWPLEREDEPESIGVGVVRPPIQEEDGDDRMLRRRHRE